VTSREFLTHAGETCGHKSNNPTNITKHTEG
jgi:hypothetical protein